MFADPNVHIEYLDLAQGMKVADIGAGSGHHTLAIAEAIGKNGTVYAIDVQKELLSRIKKEALEQHLNNVEIIWADVEKPDATGLAQGSVDRIVVSNVFFQFEDKNGAMVEINRILKPHGKLLLVDWSESFGSIGPHADMVVSPLDAEQIFIHAGFIKVRNVEAGEHHYGIIFTKN